MLIYLASYSINNMLTFIKKQFQSIRNGGQTRWLDIRILIAYKLSKYRTHFDELWASKLQRAALWDRWRQLSQKAGTRRSISISRDLVLPSVARRVRSTWRLKICGQWTCSLVDSNPQCPDTRSVLSGGHQSNGSTIRPILDGSHEPRITACDSMIPISWCDEITYLGPYQVWKTASKKPRFQALKKQKQQFSIVQIFGFQVLLFCPFFSQIIYLISHFSRNLWVQL